jgi:hypothetical protein
MYPCLGTERNMAGTPSYARAHLHMVGGYHKTPLHRITRSNTTEYDVSSECLK